LPLLPESCSGGWKRHRRHTPEWAQLLPLLRAQESPLMLVLSSQPPEHPQPPGPLPSARTPHPHKQIPLPESSQS
jgi:hypothetical protein